MRILVVEDEVSLAETLTEMLKLNKYTFDAVYNGRDGLDYGLTGIYDAIILDIMLPKMNGLDVLQNLRKNNISTPVLLLTAKSEIQDKITGLDTGADDYLTKPFSMGELMARLRAMTRRKENFTGNILYFSDLSLNKNTYELTCNNQSIKLGAKEYQLIEMLLSTPKQIIPKELFIEKIWGYDSDVEYNNIEVYVSFLRKKMNLLNSIVKISTSRGVGYYLEEKND